MYLYFKRLFVCLEAISHPTIYWWRKNGEVAPETNSRKTKAHIPSPDSVDVRAKSGKKDNSPRYSPAP
jgi:hypothetical protein